jgi:hypothetical protein
MVNALVDTGFDGWLSLPPALIASLGLAWHRRGRAILADGSETVFDIYAGALVWDPSAVTNESPWMNGVLWTPASPTGYRIESDGSSTDNEKVRERRVQ